MPSTSRSSFSSSSRSSYNSSKPSSSYSSSGSGYTSSSYKSPFSSSPSKIDQSPGKKTVQEQKSQIQPPQSFGFFNSIKEGFGIGFGASLASRAVDSLFGPRTIQVRHNSTETSDSDNSKNSNDTCDSIYKNFQKCIDDGRNDCYDLIPARCKNSSS